MKTNTRGHPSRVHFPPEWFLGRTILAPAGRTPCHGVRQEFPWNDETPRIGPGRLVLSGSSDEIRGTVCNAHGCTGYSDRSSGQR